MDNFTHTFAAIACTHAVSRDQPSGLTVAAAALAANVQDVDWLAFVSSLGAGLELHRGMTHSLLAMPLLALAAAGLGWLGSSAASPFGLLLRVCLVAAASHPLLDLLTPYGLRPFLPFSGRWWYGDLAAIADPWIWLFLGGTALLLSGRHRASVSTWTVVGSVIVVAALRLIPAKGTFGVVAGLVWIAGAAAVLIAWLYGVSPRARRAVATGGLAVTLLYVGGLAVLHQRALTRARLLAERAAAEHGERLVRVAAIPTVGDLSTWRGLAETERSVYRFAIPLGDTSGGPVERFRSIRDPTVSGFAREHTRLTRAFLSYARFIAVDVRMQDGERVVLLADPRYDKAEPDHPKTWPVREPLDR